MSVLKPIDCSSGNCLSIGSYLPPAKHKKEKESVEREGLESFIDVLPETVKLEEVLSDFYCSLHKDKKIPEFTKFFTQILNNNSSTLQHLNPAQKAQILFDKYRELTLDKFSKSDQYKTAYQALNNKIGEFLKDRPYEQILKEKIDRSLKNRINLLHSTFIAFSIAPTMGIQPWEIHFSSQYQYRDLDMSKVNLSILEG